MSLAAVASAPAQAASTVEQFGVTAQPPSVNLGAGNLGAKATLHVTGGPDSPKVRFQLFNNSMCSEFGMDVKLHDEQVDAQEQGSNLTAATLIGYEPNAVWDTLYWRATYTDLDNSGGVTTACGIAVATVDKADPTLVLSPSAPQLGTPEQLTIQARVTNRHFESGAGTLSFELFKSHDCGVSGGDGAIETAAIAYPLDSEPELSSPFSREPDHAGTDAYSWRITYDDLNNAASRCVSTDVEEADTEVVITAEPTATRLGAAPLLAKAKATGRAHPLAGATMTFRLYGGSGCTGTLLLTTVVLYPVAEPADPAGVSSDPHTPQNADAYSWQATYSGDENNKSDVGPCTPVMVDRATTTTLTTTPLPSGGFTVGELGAELTDRVTVTDRFKPINNSGTISFKLYRPGDMTCQHAPVFTAIHPDSLGLGASQTRTSEGHEPKLAGRYHWRVTYSGDATNEPVTTPCTDANSTLVAKRTPVVSIDPSDDIFLNEGTLTANAALEGEFDLNLDATAPGTMVFSAYRSADCSGDPVFTSNAVTYPSTGGAVTSTPAFSPPGQGTYTWKATFSGDDNRFGAPSPCGESVTVHKARPHVTNAAASDFVLGDGSLTAVATVTGEFATDGSADVKFELYGPDDDGCAGGPPSGTPLSTTSIDVDGGSATAPPLAPTDVGTYRWVATYTGDDNNAEAVADCADTVVSQAEPTLTTAAVPATIELGAGEISATTAIADRQFPEDTANVVFRLYGPNDDDCASEAAFTSTAVAVTGTGTVTVASPIHTPLRAGVYRWRASYSGDANNISVVDDCDVPGQKVVVGGVTPTLTTQASPSIVVGAGSILARTSVTGRINAVGGTIDFSLYGPNDVLCSGTPVFTSRQDYPPGDEPVPSTAFTPTQAGTYRWVASYSGDENNLPATGACNDPGTSVIATVNGATLTATASPAIVLGTASLTDSVTIDRRISPQPGATVDFRVYGPDDPGCSRRPTFESLGVAYPVAGGPLKSAAYTPIRAGVYRWIAAYSGDANNAPLTTGCTNENATTVSPSPPKQPRRTSPLRVTSKTSPPRDRELLYTFTTTGRVVPPPRCKGSVTAATATRDCVLPVCPRNSTDPNDCRFPSLRQMCRLGKVTVRLQRGGYTISARRVSLSDVCTFRSRVSLQSDSTIRSGRLKVVTRFEGGTFLLPKNAAPDFVRAG